MKYIVEVNEQRKTREEIKRMNYENIEDGSAPSYHVFETNQEAVEYENNLTNELIDKGYELTDGFLVQKGSVYDVVLISQFIVTDEEAEDYQ